MLKTTMTGIYLKEIDNGFELFFNNQLFIKHTVEKPSIFVGVGKENIEMYRGNFNIKDYLVERIGLRFVAVTPTDSGYTIQFSTFKGGDPILLVGITEEEGRLKLEYTQLDESINRFWLRVVADKSEKVYGCGEQLSHFNMRGKNFPLWTSEPGVGRNKNTYTTWQADVKDKAGGDYYNTNYPQPTFVSTKKYYCHVETTAYADFDFRNPHFHELQIWEIPKYVLFETADTYLELVEKMTAVFGRQPELPDWVYNGVILGIQGGTEVVEEKLNKALEKGVKVAGVWCQDWQGKRITSFGKRLMWNWEWNQDEYPKLDQKIVEWKQKGIRFLGYINPYVAVEGHLYKEANEKGYLALNEAGETYLVDFGEFYCGVVDFTNEEATQWYKKVIQTNMIEFGLDGWMADFGEYLPTDVVLKNEEDAKKMHNAWPTLWAKTNYEAVSEAGKLGEVVYFMRAGYTGVQKYCTLLWGGDQSVDWSRDDGLASVIPAALSSGMTGCGLHHSDIGGYTSLHGNKRSKELLLRWTEMAAFTPFMRTHEGNRPDDCFQFDGDDETLEHLAKMTTVYTTLAPYTKSIVKENADRGIPVQRPLFMHYEQDEKAYDIQYQYLYGQDLLVAPVHQELQTKWDVYLPEDDWVHLWSGKEYRGGEVSVEAPIGYPPVFYRKSSEWKALFKKISTM
ncbi:alpha-glucosidase [Priestia flexa]|jgi:sulfoquinovosidase|uniref:alpha-glucosidase n=1 Tax=Priestia flexa TaxID=86664 RepID=UPI001A8F52EE|nr:alpha-glucosidase [Priestia flexa]MBN8436331.1 alpha-glucosidase [Priestia flexa]MCA0968916.1 alpha-glucosidase [Priestia flexa]